MKWLDFEGRGLWVRPEKGEGESMEQANFHLCPKPLLAALLEAQAERGLEADPNDTILLNAWGKPYATTATLSHAFRREFIKMAMAKRGDSKKLFTMHGLRKTAASEVAGLLVGTQGIKSVTGHKSDSMAAYYAREAEKRAMNAKVVERWNADIDEREAEAAKQRASVAAARRAQ